MRRFYEWLNEHETEKNCLVVYVPPLLCLVYIGVRLLAS